MESKTFVVTGSYLPPGFELVPGGEIRHDEKGHELYEIRQHNGPARFPIPSHLDDEWRCRLDYMPAWRRIRCEEVPYWWPTLSHKTYVRWHNGDVPGMFLKYTRLFAAAIVSEAERQFHNRVREMFRDIEEIEGDHANEDFEEQY